MNADLALPNPAAARLVPPRPKPITEQLPLWRLILQLRRNALVTWGEPAYEVDIIGRPFLGRQSHLVNAPQAIKRILVDNHANYGRTPATVRILHPMIGDGLFLAEGAAWRHQRRTAAPAFAARSMDLVARHVVAVADETVERLAASGPAPVSLLKVMQLLALEVAGRALLSTPMAGHGSAVRAGIETYGRRFARPSFLDFLLPAEAPHPLAPLRRRAGRDFKAVLKRIIDARAKLGVADPPRDLYDLLVKAKDPETGEGFGPDLLRDQIATLLIAGHETTALLLFWSFYVLALDPSWQERIATEVSTLEGPLETAAERLPVTRAVVQEVLRLYPPAFTIVRVAKAADEVAGRKIEAGSLVVIAPWVLHRHKRLWQDPHAFDPGRFLPGAPPIDRFAWLPFGVGPRVCIGAQFSLTEATLVLARLLSTFRVEITGPRRVTPVGVVTLVPDRAPAFRLTARD